MKNIEAIGVDIISHKKIEDKKNSWKRFLTKKELSIANSKETIERQISFVAGRWAAKEGIIKASHSEKISYQDIEIINDYSGRPITKVNGKNNYEVSISHEKDTSIAIVRKVK